MIKRLAGIAGLLMYLFFTLFLIALNTMLPPSPPIDYPVIVNVCGFAWVICMGACATFAIFSWLYEEGQ